MVDMARGLAQIVADHGLSELILESKEVTLTVRRGVTSSVASQPMAAHLQQAPTAFGHPPAMSFAAAAPAPAPVAAPVVDDKSHVVTSPFVGTFYRKPSPDSPFYVSLESKVEKGAVLCIIEAMKLMNEIEADMAGTIVGILVEDGSSVEYGQPLFKIRP